ncbi:universal stress protein [Endozoicomonas sp. SM1973]|uniref:Universal stress protein n=1 Tax=Spartinivicinus marinus TaxID=2994442 RepID=A0A853IBC9_9GAMM|nr:universal stress protein [Spartinivicinus marinus]MCX4024822.1 universal stress protein [Spartinivicinus marinus]NYZ66535.1 universal stress protein [Spartinivicinus marinus]
MEALKRILVVVNPEATGSFALKRAKLIAQATGATIHLLACNKRPNNQWEDWLNAQASTLHQEGLNAIPHQAWHESFHETVIHFQQAERCQLIIKEAIQENEVKRLINIPVDWKVLRYTTVPVLIVKQTSSWCKQPIVAAIDAYPQDDNHQILNDVIVNYAQAITEFSESDCHIITAYPPPMLSSPDPVFQNAALLEDKYRQACQKYLDMFSMSPQQLHIGEGPATSLIPTLVKKLNAPLIVLGTVARKGLSGAVIGNTAEYLLDELDCDILTLRPNQFMDSLESILENK